MRVLVVGGGGREHALAWRLARDPGVDALLAAPGNAGIEDVAACLAVSGDDVRGLVDLVERERIDLTVVGPEAPLVAGLADALGAVGHAVFGPTTAGARLEGSKAWTKELCERYAIPAARSRSFTELAPAIAYLDALDPPYVVKADGLAAGKGVAIAEERGPAVEALRACLEEGAFGHAGSTVLVEEYLSGREVSAFALSDGRDILPLVMAQDFKRIGDGDTGPNTGGMGAYSPVPFVDEATASWIWDEVIGRTVRAMAAEGVVYRGVLYAGLMLTDDGPRLLEYNCRFGDPETEVIMPRWDSGLAEVMLACAQGELGTARAAFASDWCVTVVLASGGYPGPYDSGVEIDGLEAAEEVEGAIVFHAGTTRRDGRVVTSGGRVLAVSALAASPAEARSRAYEACSRISFPGMQYRKDIALRVAEEAG